ncbi:MAG TPA: FAD:protein FMN transferase [Solirubrobacteraceae bacterium]|nr:FAD:protein FMN transferase [Solirubrobacteraceae bacterium]
MPQATNTFTCFGGNSNVLVEGAGPAGTPAEAVTTATDQLLIWHAQFSRFKTESELGMINRDPRERFPVSPTMAAFVQAVVDSASRTGGLVDATLLDQIEEVGYRSDHLRASLALPLALALAPPREPARPDPAERWRGVSVDLQACEVTRPPGLHLDGGGIVKGLFADLIGELLAGHDAYVVDCEGDLRVGGAVGIARTFQVTAPFDGSVLHELAVTDGGVATSSITKRSWLDRGRPAHHLLDPSTGRPAYTGVVQVTALAPSALEGEALAKAALLSGPDEAAGWLPHGGVIVFDDLSHRVVAPAAAQAV